MKFINRYLILSFFVLSLILVIACNQSDPLEKKINKTISQENYTIQILYKKEIGQVVYLYKDKSYSLEITILQAMDILSERLDELYNILTNTDSDLTDEEIDELKRYTNILYESGKVSSDNKHDDENLNDDYDAIEHIKMIITAAEILKKKRKL